MTPHKDRLPQTPERLVFGGGSDPKRHPVTGMVRSKPASVLDGRTARIGKRSACICL
jgi:hypothetical protein